MEQGNAGINKKLIDNLLSDLRALSNESKRKCPPVKEAAEGCMLKVRNLSARSHNISEALMNCSEEILRPFILGAETKILKIVQISMIGVQRMVTHKAVTEESAAVIVNSLWSLMMACMEELKLLQTTLILLTTTDIVRGKTLAKAIVLCCRLHFSKDVTISNTAAATIRQAAAVIFDRVISEDTAYSAEVRNTEAVPPSPVHGSKDPPPNLRPSAADAFMFFRDLCQLGNADCPYWLEGINEIPRTFGLELMESVLNGYSQVFLKHPQFLFLLKERVCPLVIKLFSPSIKYKLGIHTSNATPTSPSVIEKPNFPVCLRLLRVVYILINQYYSVLVTECEIFLSLVVKFLDADKPIWQRALAVEVLHKLCIQPKLIKSFCQNYDMKVHSTKVFQEIVNAVSTFVQSMFASNPSTTALTALSTVTGVVPSGSVGPVTVGENVSSQPAFSYRNIWIPITFLPQSGVAKTVYMEMLDKTDVPIVQDGYALTVSFGCLLDIVKCISMVVTAERNEGIRRGEAVLVSGATPSPPTQSQSTTDVKSNEGLPLWRELITSSWCGVLAAFSLLLDASNDDTATELILKSDEVYLSLCGVLDLSTPRDAFVTALCKASLPPHYAITMLNSHNSQTKGHARKPSGDLLSNPDDSRGQGATIGTSPSSTNQTSQSTVVTLTAKNLQCMSAILSVAHCHGGILGTSWHLVLTTLQHLVWMLGMRPISGGSLKVTEAPTSIVSNAAVNELPVLSSMLSRLFESSQFLNDVALHHLIDALCKLSNSAMESAKLSKEPALFAVAKLLETGLVNLIRVEVFWKPVTAHLLEVCQHSHVKLREWGAEGVTALVKASLSYDYDQPLTENHKLQAMLLAPLQELSAITHSDIRQKQLECVLMILQERGYNLGHGWPLVLNVIGHVTDQQGESLIRLAFQSLQLVVTDFLHMMKCSCLQLCVEVAAKFSLQNQELNISLTSIGLLWNISDYIYQHRDRIKQELEQEEVTPDPDPAPVPVPAGPRMPPSDLLWMCLYLKLGDRCVDERPAVRKSAGQTLFSTITAHGSVLDRATWHTVLWQVLFPLLERVKKLSSTAANERNSSGTGNILMHHSRDTAEKQWAETRVLTLAGVARVFNSRRNILQQLGDFPRAWALLLEYIEYAALSRNNEVSLNALKSFQEILQLQHRTGSDSQEEVALWANAWRVWYSIGVGSTSPPSSGGAPLPHGPADGRRDPVFVPTQPFLTALVQIFPMLFDRIKPRFVAADLLKLATVLRGAVSVPIQTEVSPYIVPCVTEAVLTSLQDSVLGAINALEREMSGGSDAMKAMYPALFDQLLTFVTYACQPPRFGKYDMKLVEPVGTNRNSHAEWIVMNYVPFAERSLDTVVNLYEQTARHQAVIEQHVLQNTIRTLRLPLGMKYGCPSATTWKLTVKSLMDVLNTGLAVASEHCTDSHFNGMWTELGLAFEEFLFSKHPPPPTLSLDEHKRDEALDTQIITMIRQQILPQAKVIPQPFVAKIMNLLNKGSIHSATSATFTDADPSKKLREDFARSCFETLLQFSFITKNSESEEGAITKLALTALLKRCQDVLKKYVEDERLSGKCPLPRPRMSEIAFVLKAISTLMMSLKSADQENIDTGVWNQVVNIYPYLVDCTMCSSSQVCKALKEALHQYRDLLAPPNHSTLRNHLTNGK